jgi:hypothetical protein
LSSTRAEAMALPPRQRSAVTNGRRSFVQGDGNTQWARRWRDLIALHASDLGGGDQLSEAQRSLIRRAATIEIELEAQEGKLSEGIEVDLDTYARAAGHLRRVLETLGIERHARNVTPDPLSYARAMDASR